MKGSPIHLMMHTSPMTEHLMKNKIRSLVNKPKPHLVLLRRGRFTDICSRADQYIAWT